MTETKAIILKSLKYGDTSLIIHCFCREGGMQSFLIKGYFANSKKKSRVFPLSEIEVAFHEGNQQTLHNLYKIESTGSRQDISSNPIKSMIVQLMAEILFYLLKTQSSQSQIYDFLIRSLEVYYHKTGEYADFHIWLFSRLLLQTGLAPNFEGHGDHFNLLEGTLVSFSHAPFLLTASETQLWMRLFDSHFDLESPNQFNRQERQKLTEILLQWCEIHIPEFKTPQSVEIIREILR